MSTEDNPSCDPALVWLRAIDDLYASVLALRHNVFVIEQGVPSELEVDAFDDSALHLAAVSATSGRPGVVGTLRLIIDDAEAHIGRVAVRWDCRRQGIGSNMVRKAKMRAWLEGCTKVELAAQITVTQMYEKLGFAVTSEPFDDAGILHVNMALIVEQ